MSNNFKTCGEAWRYCEKYGLDNITAAYSFSIAEALLRAYKDGAIQSPAAQDSEGRVVLESFSILGDEETFNNGLGW